MHCDLLAIQDSVRLLYLPILEYRCVLTLCPDLADILEVLLHFLLDDLLACQLFHLVDNRVVGKVCVS